MTACNLIVQAKAGAAFLITDTARYDRTGVVGEFASKVMTLAGRGFSAAIATTGMTSEPYFAGGLAKLQAPNAEDLLRALPAVFRYVEAELIAAGKPEATGCGTLAAVVALFDRETGEPSGWAIGNDNSLFPRGQARPYELRQVRRYLTRYAGEPFRRGVDLCDPRQWDPERDGAALLEAQRADLFGIEPATYRAVGGAGVLVRVDAAGVTSKRLVTWPDRIGRRIDPDARPGWLASIRGRLAA